MRRVCTLVGLTVFALAAGANVAHATTTGETQSGEVKSLAVVSASGRAEVVIAVDNSVSIQDFSLADPSRVVLDLKGAKLTRPRASTITCPAAASPTSASHSIARTRCACDRSRCRPQVRGHPRRQRSPRRDRRTRRRGLHRLARRAADHERRCPRAKPPRTSHPTPSPRHLPQGERRSGEPDQVRRVGRTAAHHRHLPGRGHSRRHRECPRPDR